MKIIYSMLLILLTVLVGTANPVFAQESKAMLDSSGVYIKMNDLGKALEWAKKARDFSLKKNGDRDTVYIASFNSIAEIYYYLGNLPKAIENSEKCIKLVEEVIGKESFEYVNNIGTLALFYNKSGRGDEAEKYYTESLELSRKIYTTDHQLLAWTIGNNAMFLGRRGKLDEAESLYRESIAMSRRIYQEDDPLLSWIVGGFASFMYEKGNFKEAEKYYLESLAMKRRMFKTDHPELALCINNLASLYTSAGRYAEAEPLNLEALEKRKRLYKGDHPGLANSYHVVGYFYEKAGRINEAIKYYTLAIEMRRRIYKVPHRGLLASINNLGTLYLRQGNIEKAEPYIMESERLCRQIYPGDNKQKATIIQSSGGFYTEKGDLDTAEAKYKEAYDIKSRLNNGINNDIASIQFCLADCYYQMNKYEESEKYFTDAMSIYKKLYPDGHIQISTCALGMAQLYDKMNKYEESEKLILEALAIERKIIDNFFPSLSAKEKQMFWRKDFKNHFEAFNSFAVHRSETNPNIISNLYDLRLYSKAILFNSTSKVKKRILKSKDSVLIKTYKQWRSYKEELVKLYSITEKEQKRKGINIDSIETKANTLEKELSLKSEQFKQSYEKKKIGWRTIQAVLNPDEAAVEVIRFRLNLNNRFTDTVYYAFLIINENTVDHPDMFVLKNGNELEKEFYNYYRKQIKDKQLDDKSFKRYWHDLHEKLKGYKKIYFSTDGIYNKLNPATLMLDTKTYLLDIYDIQQINSTKDILLSFYQSKQESNILNDAVLIGNPNFSLSLAEVRQAGEALDQEDAIDEDIDDDIEIATTRGIILSSLPGTEKEINDIEEFLSKKKWQVSSYLGDMALKKAIKSANSPRVLHIATHGLFLEDIGQNKSSLFAFEKDKMIENPLLRSGLFFTGADNYLKADSSKPSGDDNGILTAYEAMNLDLDHTELVVLSACETGLGEIINGEGVFGLRRAFQQAGAKTIIMSLWAVSDRATQELMSSFYRHWVSGMTKREAFQKAQEEIKAKYKDPYYWGAFVMVGE
jgi:CHAT domain-containing protein